MKVKKHKKLVALIMIFTFPLVSSWLVYTYHAYFHFKTTNHGCLITPPVPVGQLVEAALEHKQWVIAFAPQRCDDVQSDHVIFELRQLRKALGENAYRVSVVLWDNQSCLPKLISDVKKVSLSNQQVMILQNALHQHAMFITDKIYLIDPLGNLFMYYPANTDVMNIFSDLKKVLGVSQIG